MRIASNKGCENYKILPFEISSNRNGRRVVGIEPVQALAGERLLPFLRHGNHRLVLIGQRRIESLAPVGMRFTYHRRTNSRSGRCANGGFPCAAAEPGWRRAPV